jgi:hypothetical protein
MPLQSVVVGVEPTRRVAQVAATGGPRDRVPLELVDRLAPDVYLFGFEREKSFLVPLHPTTGSTVHCRNPV